MARKKNVIFCVAVILLLLLPCCDRDKKEKTTTPDQSVSGHNQKMYIRLKINLPGDDYAQQVDIKARRKIEEYIAKRKIGTIISTGSGMGMMDMIITIDKSAGVTQDLGDIVRQVLPGAKYSIHFIAENQFKSLDVAK